MNFQLKYNTNCTCAYHIDSISNYKFFNPILAPVWDLEIDCVRSAPDYLKLQMKLDEACGKFNDVTCVNGEDGVKFIQDCREILKGD